MFRKVITRFYRWRSRGARLRRSLILAILLFILSMGSPVVVAQVSLSTPARLNPPSQLVEQARTLYQAGQLEAAATAWQQATEAFAERGDRLNQGMALSNLSLTYQQLGKWDEAKRESDRSLNLLQTQERTPAQLRILAQSLEIQGQLELAVGQPQNALSTWQQSAEIYENIDLREGEIRTQINQAQAMQDLGLYPRACQSLLKALELDSENCDISQEQLQTFKAPMEKPSALRLQLLGLRSLGTILLLVGKTEQAQMVLVKSWELAQQTGDAQNLAATYLSLGNTARALGNRKSQREEQTQQQMTRAESGECIQENSQPTADQLYQQAAACYRQAKSLATSPTTSIEAQLNLLSLLVQSQQWSQAAALVSQIQSNLEQVKASRRGVYARINLAQSLICLRGGLTQEELEFSSPLLQQCSFPKEKERAIEQEKVLTKVPSWQDIGQIVTTALNQARFLGDKQAESYAIGYLGGIEQQMEKLSSAQELTEKALQLISTFDSPNLAYLWQWQLGRIHQINGERKSAIAAYTAAFETLKSLRSDLVTTNPEVQFTFRDSVEPVYRELVALLLQPPPTDLNRGVYPRESGVSQDNLRKAREVIQALGLAELNNFFQLACGEFNPKQIDELVDQAPRATASFYAILLRDSLEVIVKLPKQETLLHYTTPLPENTGEELLAQLQEYLLDVTRTFQVRQLSQKVYQWLIQPAEAQLTASGIKTLVFVLDSSLRNIPMAVLYDGQKYLVEKYALDIAPGLQLLSPQPLREVGLNALIAGLSEQRQFEGKPVFPPLENVRSELEQIKSVLPSVELFNDKFTQTNLQEQIKKGKFSVVHLATHAQFSSDPEDTFILLSDKLLSLKDFENLLQTDVSSRSTSIELLVLSACETATGDNRALLGLAGLAVKAGARSTIATLWSVSDEPFIASFMRKFYQELKKPNVTKAEALQRTQLSLLKEAEEPFFWAPYILVGNWL